MGVETNYQVLYVDGDIPTTPIRLGQLVMDGTVLKRCTALSPLTYTAVGGGGGSPGGSNFQLQYNDAGTFNGFTNGTAGWVLTSNGAGSAPSFQAPTGGGTYYKQLASSYAAVTPKAANDTTFTTIFTYVMPASTIPTNGTLLYQSIFDYADSGFAGSGFFQVRWRFVQVSPAVTVDFVFLVCDTDNDFFALSPAANGRVFADVTCSNINATNVQYFGGTLTGQVAGGLGPGFLISKRAGPALAALPADFTKAIDTTKEQTVTISIAGDDVGSAATRTLDCLQQRFVLISPA
jgi:hypothetical protein